MYAIRHKKTHEWVYGTDYRCHHKRKDGKRSYSQRTSFERALTFENFPNARFEFDVRGCSPRYYEIVPVKLVIDTDNYEWLLCEKLLASGKGELNGRK